MSLAREMVDYNPTTTLKEVFKSHGIGIKKIKRNLLRKKIISILLMFKR